MGTIRNADRLARSIPGGFAFKDRLRFLARIEAAERPDVAEHARAVSRTSMRLADGIGMTREEILDVGIAARWHDIGKLAVDEKILTKTGRLTEDEFGEIKAHVESGVKFLGPEAPRIMLDATGYHHERYDGWGYVGLKGEDIPLVARIVAIADVHDALMSERDYKAPMSEEDALGLMTRNADSPGFGRRNFDPFLLRRFVAVRLADPGFSASSDGRADLEEYAGSDPMSDLDHDVESNDGWLVKKSGYRLRYSVDEASGGRRLVDLLDPAGRPSHRRRAVDLEMDRSIAMC